jgi:hypothetical protein
VGFRPLISLNLTNGYPNKNKNNNNNNNKVKSKPLELFELAGKNSTLGMNRISFFSVDLHSKGSTNCSFLWVFTF